MSEVQIKLRYRFFKDGWKSVESDPRTGRPSTSRINENRRLTMRELEETLGIPQKITKDYYIEVLRRMRDAVKRKRPQLWSSGDWQLHHDNAPAHPKFSCRLFGKTSHYLGLSAPYSPDLALCDFWLFQNLNSSLKRRICVNATVTQYTSSVNGVSLPTD
jgi:hypothetical protein